MGNNLIVVGAGIGGMTAAITAAELGLAVTLVEKGEKVGGAPAFGRPGLAGREPCRGA